MAVTVEETPPDALRMGAHYDTFMMNAKVKQDPPYPKI